MTITNGDLPAMPITNEQAQDADMWGLTKREMMAMHMMNGLLSKSGHSLNERDVARDAVRAADALLVELERTK